VSAARPISVRLPAAMLEAMDRHLEQPDAGVRTRTDLIQAAIELWLRADESARIDAEIAAAYTRTPVRPREDAGLVRAAEEAERSFEPW